MESESKFRRAWFTPVFSSLLEHRLEGIVLVGVGALQLGLYLLGLSGWVCPIKAVFGIPCPGCGLTVAIGELLHGDVLASLRTHAFAPVFLVAFLILLVAIFLPEKQRGRLVDTIARLETSTGFTAWVLSGLMLYWIIRLFGLA
jgi:NhaP-type Na+/H+ or K+/H+ antiporter